MISKDVEGTIRRLALIEHWPVGTIARELHVHHSVVRRVLGRGQPAAVANQVRPTIFDPYLPFIRETLEKYPRLKASRLHGMLRERGFRGCASHLRELVARLRPRPAAEAYLRLKTLPGEQAQVDWAHFGHLEIGKARRPLAAFLMVLSYSRALYLRFFLDMRQASFLKGHVLAFEFFGAVPRTVLYDNLKSAVLERRGDAIRFHPAMLEFASHYGFEPRPVAVARGNEKGRVERMVRTVREGFFAARVFRDLDDLNAQALAWCQREALDRPFVEDRSQSVRDALDAERPSLLPLPDDHFPTDECVEAKVLKTPYARFDLNDYSVPHDRVMRTLTVRADDQRVRIFDQDQLIAEHDRSYSRGERIEDPRHIERLVAEKREARTHRAVDRLRLAAPSTQVLLEKIAGRGLPLERATRQLERLLDAYGALELERAVVEVLRSGAHHDAAVRHVLEKNREEAGKRPALPLPLDDADPRLRIAIPPHSLDSYAELHDAVIQYPEPPEPPLADDDGAGGTRGEEAADDLPF